jgi:hypothetical protein
MSIGFGGVAGSAAGSQLAQTSGTDVDRTSQEVAGAVRKADYQLKAEAAAGIGETDGEDHESEDRDADGRRPWTKFIQEPPEEEKDDQPKSKDATGQSGNLLDLSG